MTDQPNCEACADPVHDMAYICTRCGKQLRRALVLAVMAAGEAAITIARLDHLDGPGAPQDDPEPWDRNANALYPTPLPIDLSAAADHDAAIDTLTVWARHIARHRGIPLPAVRYAPCDHGSCFAARRRQIAGPTCKPRPPRHPVAIICLWIGEHIDWLRHRPEAAQAFDELTDGARLLVRVVDRPPQRWYAGPCNTCEEELYPITGATTHTCTCGTVHDLAERKAKLVEQLDDVWGTATQCAHTLTKLGVPTNASTIRTWAQRGRLAPHPESLPGQPRYLVGSVRSLVLEAKARAFERRLREAVKAAEKAQGEHDQAREVEAA